MKQLLKNFTKKSKKRFIQYILGLILNPEKNTCSKIAKFFGIKHDSLYRILWKTGFSLFIFSEINLAIANYFSKEKRGWLIIDDTLMLKPFIKFLAGVYDVYNVVLSRPDRGLCLVVIAWSNGNVTISLMFEFMYHKDLVGKDYKTKTEIAKLMILKLLGKISFRYILFDGHYSTIEMLKFLCEMRIFFIAKIARNRKIKTKDGIFERLDKHPLLKLLRNRRSKKVRAHYNDMSLYFSSHKRKNKQNEYAFTYIVSNIKLDSKKYLEIYKDRWAIETMFRTMKQYLGFSHCQCIGLERQKAHIYMVFIGYSFLEKEKHENSFKCPEDALKHLQKVKSSVAIDRISAFSENFQCFAQVLYLRK